MEVKVLQQLYSAAFSVFLLNCPADTAQPTGK